MKIDFLTIFPDIFETYLKTSMMNIANKKGTVEFGIWNIRDYSFDRHRTVDDYPYGGGPGMVMKVEPLYLCLKDCLKEKFEDYRNNSSVRVVLMSAQGSLYDQNYAHSIKNDCEHLIFVCGHYRGVDERFLEFITDEISVGDYVLTGGELPALIIADSVVRLLPDVLNNEESVSSDSFYYLPMFDGPLYTRPREFMGKSVPEVLYSGNHALIEKYRVSEGLKKTRTIRPDLFEKLPEDMRNKI